MGVILGGVSSLLYGVGDFLGGVGARRISAPSVVLWAGVVSFPLITLVAILLGGEIESTDWALGLGAGAVGALGLVALFAGLGRGHAAAVAPASAAMGAALPVVFGVISGDQASALAWWGVALAIPSIVLCSWVADAGDVPFGGVGYGLAAGVGFGLYTVIISFTSESSGLLPLIGARGAALITVLVVASTGVWRLVGPRAVPWKVVGGSGLLDVAANATLLIALRSGALALVGVAASFYPAVTVLLSRMVNHEHLRGRQILGLTFTVLAVGLIAAGQI